MIYNDTTRYYMLLQEETTIILVFTSNITNTSLIIVILTDSFDFANSDFWGVCACYFLRISAMKVL